MLAPHISISSKSKSNPNDAALTPGPSINQYCRSVCHTPLAQSLADEYNARPSWKAANITVDPMSNVVSSLGCTQIMYVVWRSACSENERRRAKRHRRSATGGTRRSFANTHARRYIAFRSILKPADEVILLEPAFDIYASQVTLCGGTPKFVSLVTDLSGPSDNLTANTVFKLDFDALEAAITDKTRVLVLNTPHNPTGKMFTMKEQTRIAEIVSKWPNLVVFSDEVYEHMVYDEACPHISFATLPGMYERTLTMSSAGKTFSTTGWKVGWAIGPAALIKQLSDLQQWVCFSAPSVTQEAIARSLKIARDPYEGCADYYEWLKGDYARKRKYLCETLRLAGFAPIVPDGGFFVCADTSNKTFPDSVYEEEGCGASPRPMPRDWALARYMTHTDPKVAVIPPSPFYSPENVDQAKNYVR